MNRRKIRQIMKDHLSITPEDNFSYDSIPDSTWPAGFCKTERNNKRHAVVPRWVISLASIIATFIFMLTPPGQAVSSFVCNIDIHWNEEKSKLEIHYDNNVEYDAYPGLTKDLQTANEFYSIDELSSSYPKLQILQNKKQEMTYASVSGDDESMIIVSQYIINGKIINVSQIIYYSEHTSGMSISLTENAIPIEATFNFGSIKASGGYEDGYANLVAFDNNCEYSFTCDNLPKEEIIDFIEHCYIK